MNFEAKEAREKLQKFLRSKIPMTQAMKLSLDKFDGNHLSASAPLDENINDKGSVFGGSSSSLMIITAWSLIKLKCLEYTIDADIVIHKNSCHWHKAMYSSLKIVAQFKHDNDFLAIKDKLFKKKHHRIECKIELVDNDGVLYSTMKANYVIIPKK